MYRIVIADDEPIMRKGMTSLIDWNTLDCEIVLVASDGQTVINTLSQYNPDIVILDIKMPLKTGIDVARYICEKNLPIKVILLTAFADFSYAQQAIKYGVTEYVTKNGAMEGIIEAVKKCKNQLKLESRRKYQINEQVNLILKNIIDGSLYSKNEIMENMNKFDIDLSDFYILSVDFIINNKFENQLENRLNSSFEVLIKNVFKYTQIFFIPIKKDRFCIILKSPVSNIYKSCVEISDTFYKITGCKVYIGISELCHTALKLKEAYEQANISLEGRFFKNDMFVHSFSEYKNKNGTRNGEIPRITSKISNAIGICKKNEALDFLENMFVLQSKKKLSPQEVKDDGIMLINLCKLTLGQVGKGINEISKNIDYYDEIRNSRFFTDYCKILRYLVINCCNETASKLHYSSDIIIDAQDYIDKNYDRPVSLKEIAAAVNVNPSYLSRTFKDKTGMNIVETINRKRINRAIELLEAGQMKINEISFAVGIEDTTYFSHLFRKYMGVSPKIYQKRYQKLKLIRG